MEQPEKSFTDIFQEVRSLNGKTEEDTSFLPTLITQVREVSQAFCLYSQNIPNVQ